MTSDYEGTESKPLTYREALREVELLRGKLAVVEGGVEQLHAKLIEADLDLAAMTHQRDEANALSDENVEKLRSMERMECKVHGSWHPVFDGACIECLASALSSLEKLRMGLKSCKHPHCRAACDCGEHHIKCLDCGLEWVSPCDHQMRADVEKRISSLIEAGKLLEAVSGHAFSCGEHYGERCDCEYVNACRNWAEVCGAVLSWEEGDIGLRDL
jgi:hypothetical protein